MPTPRRPAETYDPAARVPLSFRVRPAVKARIVQAAEASGRSLMAEVETLMERAIEAESGLLAALDMAYGRTNNAIAMLVGLIASDAQRNSAEPWFEDSEPAAELAAALAITIAVITGTEIPAVPAPPAVSEATWKMRVALCLRPLKEISDYLSGKRATPARFLDEMILDRLTNDLRKRIAEAELPSTTS